MDNLKLAIKDFFKYDTVFEKTIEYNGDNIVIPLHRDSRPTVEFLEKDTLRNYPYNQLILVPEGETEYIVQYFLYQTKIVQKKINSTALLMQLLRETFERFLTVVHPGSVLDRLAAIEARQEALDELIKRLTRSRGV